MQIEELERIAIETLKVFEPAAGYYVAFSGGKDSCVIKHLVERSGVRAEYHFHVTTVDPPELLRFIREHHSDVIWDRPKYSMYKLVSEIEKIPPTRRMKFCCRHLKEGHGADRHVVLGVRAKESTDRANAKQHEFCPTLAKRKLNLIVTWTDNEVWDYIQKYKLPVCSLYAEGWTRIGCIGCPEADKQRYRQFNRWPKFRAMYVKAFEKMLENRRAKNLKTNWKTAEEVMEWWLNRNYNPNQGILNFDEEI